MQVVTWQSRIYNWYAFGKKVYDEIFRRNATPSERGDKSSR